MDVDDMLTEWYKKVFVVLNNHAPLRERKSRGNAKRPCPWLSSELQCLVRQRNYLHRKVSKQPDNIGLREEHRKARAAARKLERRFEK